MQGVKNWAEVCDDMISN